MKKHIIYRMLLLLFCLGLASCVTYQRTDLFFGRNIPDGGQVSEQQWKAFSDSVISHFFPEGYTEWNADGRWKDTKTKVTITEPTKVATFFGKPSKQRNVALDSIAQLYIRRFRQQSVLRSDSKTNVQFISKTQ